MLACYHLHSNFRVNVNKCRKLQQTRMIPVGQTDLGLEINVHLHVTVSRKKGDGVWQWLPLR